MRISRILRLVLLAMEHLPPVRPDAIHPGNETGVLGIVFEDFAQWSGTRTYPSSHDLWK